MDKKFVSIIIPCRNEERFLAKCLDSIISQDYPKENLEVFVVDGASEDKTREIANNYAVKNNFIRVLFNPRKTTPVSMNIGIKESKGEIIIKMDCHAEYQNDYISKCVANLQKYGADNVGGILKTLPSSNTPIAKSIALSLSSFFGAGNSYFRTGVKEAQEADTVSFGCYKREVFDKIGLYNENLARSQDMELNLRLKKAGGKIMLCPDIIATYYPKDNLKDFFLHNFQDGIWSIYPIKFTKFPFRARHYIPLAFVATVIFSFFFNWSAFVFISIIYFFADIHFSQKSSKEGGDSELLLPLIAVFPARHFGYGLGSIWGLIKIILKV